MAVRTLVVDDSVVVRRTLATVLAEAGDVEVVGTAPDGRIGLRRIAQLNPDVVTLDVEMPGLSGIETLAQIRQDFPTLPVIMYSTLTERGAAATLDALSLGAVDYATKPTGAVSRDDAVEQIRTGLLPLVRLWGRKRAPAGGRPAADGTAGVRTFPRTPVALTDGGTAAVGPAVGPAVGSAGASAGTPVPPAPARRSRPRLVVVGVSTGGPDALATVVPQLPADLPVPVVVVQHMPPLFTGMLADRLDRESALHVVEARDGDRAVPGTVYIAPGGHHLEVARTAAGFRLRTTDAEPENSCRPAVDVLFRSASAAAGGEVLAVVLTGMGQDGLAGVRLLRSAGAGVIVQDEATSVVWGMPGFIARAGLADAVLPLSSVAGAITQRIGASRPGTAAAPAGSLSHGSKEAAPCL